MDPLSQGVLGAIYPQAIVKDKRQIVPATIIGFLSGILPDIDSFIRFPSDPLATLEYHRHFTHSLAFIPLGALIAAGLLYLYFKGKLSFRQIYLFSFLGYATHGLLDACTSYGTQLFIPFSNTRVALDIISIIDPTFTLPILALMLLAVKKKSAKFARIAIVYSLVYLSLGFIQERRARDFVQEVATSRGHTPSEITVKPTIANLLVWKMIYRHNDDYYVDAVRILFDKILYAGEAAPKLNLNRDFPWLKEDDEQHRDVSRFASFSAGYLSVHPEFPDVIGDIRYSMEPNRVQPLWGIRLNSNLRNQHVPFETFRKAPKERIQRLWKMILGL